MTTDITVVIPTVPTRKHLLERAMRSAQDQLHQPVAIAVALDTKGEGATATRTRGLAMVQTEWTAFLDDDDEFMPEHLQALMMHQETTGADLVFPWFDVIGGRDPFPENEGRQFSLENPHQTTITFLVRTAAARDVGTFEFAPGIDAHDPGVDEQGHRAGEDFRFVIRMVEAGYRVEHLNQRTWKWHHWIKPDGTLGNSMGLPSRI